MGAFFLQTIGIRGVCKCRGWRSRNVKKKGRSENAFTKRLKRKVDEKGVKKKEKKKRKRKGMGQKANQIDEKSITITINKAPSGVPYSNQTSDRGEYSKEINKIKQN